MENELYAKVRGYISRARAEVYTVANKEMVVAYWNVGREIVEKQGGEAWAKYGDGLIKRLSLWSVRVLIMLGIKWVENRSAMPVPAKGRCAVSCSKSYNAAEYGAFVQ